MNDLEYYKQKLIIDKNNLDDCIIEQPALFQQVSSIYTQRLAERDYAYEQYKKEYARLFVEYKNSGEKLTDKLVDSMILTSPTYVEKRNEFLNKQQEANEWAALKEAYAQRNYMLKELSNLFSASYYTRDAY